MINNTTFLIPVLLKKIVNFNSHQSTKFEVVQEILTSKRKNL
jgi:hypothetical protein